jgi:hypothetical protein
MWRYRYRREYVGDDDLVARCNALGDGGWSLVGPPSWVPPEVDVHGVQRSVGVWRCFFKQVISNREQAMARFELHPQPREGVTP